LRTTDERQWDEIAEFRLASTSDLAKYHWEDKSVEQGIVYTYAIAQYGKFKGRNVYSEKILSNPCVANFEHMFLSDGEK
jgi:hypothetical protein